LRAVFLSEQRYGRRAADLSPVERDGIDEDARTLYKPNRYDPSARTLTWTDAEAYSYRRQIAHWAEYFATPARNGGLSDSYTNSFPFLPASLAVRSDRGISHVDPVGGHGAQGDLPDEPGTRSQGIRWNMIPVARTVQNVTMQLLTGSASAHGE